jgi:hypothetical protein
VLHRPDHARFRGVFGIVHRSTLRKSADGISSKNTSALSCHFTLQSLQRDRRQRGHCNYDSGSVETKDRVEEAILMTDLNIAFYRPRMKAKCGYDVVCVKRLVAVFIRTDSPLDIIATNGKDAYQYMIFIFDTSRAWFHSSMFISPSTNLAVMSLISTSCSPGFA